MSIASPSAQSRAGKVAADFREQVACLRNQVIDSIQGAVRERGGVIFFKGAEDSRPCMNYGGTDYYFDAVTDSHASEIGHRVDFANMGLHDLLTLLEFIGRTPEPSVETAPQHESATLEGVLSQAGIAADAVARILPEIFEPLRDLAVTDWHTRESIQAKMRITLRSRLLGRIPGNLLTETSSRFVEILTANPALLA